MASDDGVVPTGKSGRRIAPPEQLLADVISAIQAELEKLGYPEATAAIEADAAEHKFPRAPIL